MAVKGRQCFVACGIALVIGALLGFVVTYLVLTHGNEMIDKSVYRESDSLTREADDSISPRLLGEINADNIRGHLR